MKVRHTKVKTLDSWAFTGWPFRVEIESVVEHWREAYRDPIFYPQENYKVRTSDKEVSVLKYSTLFGSWWISESGVIK